MPTQPPVPEGRLVVGRYRLRRQLGQGSMGTVWEAYDEFLHRPVAVKEVRLPPGIPDAEAAELRERTLREARAIAVVSHPNVITLHDVARERGEPFVVMEYMAARSLAELIRESGPLTEPQAAAVCDAVAAALQAAHQAGITHRDVKPGNVLVAFDGRVKLTDFGIARNVSERTMTRTGFMLGSPAYIAPEVAAGRGVTPAADLWGLGATLFAALDGRLPYDRDEPVLETISRVVHGDVPKPNATGPLADLVSALMVKDPSGRIPLAEVRRRLRPLLPEPGSVVFNLPDEAPTKVTASVPAPDGADHAGGTDDTAIAEPVAAPATAEPASVPLAADPGPLPFDPAAAQASVRQRPAAPRRSGRGPVAATLIMALAVVLFALSAGGGFALARVLGGEPLLPPSQQGGGTPGGASAPPTELERREGRAVSLTGERGGGFTVPVPANWVSFVEQRTIDGILTSTVVHYLSQDGTQQLTVERFADVGSTFTDKDYLKTLHVRWGTSFHAVGQPASGFVGPDDRYPATMLSYTTTEVATPAPPGSAGTMNRATFASVFPVGEDLWVLAVTVPIEQQDTGEATLFDQIVPKFQLTA